MRLQKYLAASSVASRRKAEELIAAGAVAVNGVTVTQMGVQVEEGDEVTVNGKAVRPDGKKYYIMLNKPRGYVTTAKDQFGRPAVTDLVSGAAPARLFPVGRLDFDTEGLLLLTNDGDFSFALTHPKKEVQKTYIARILGEVKPEDLAALSAGVVIDTGPTAPAKFEVKKRFPKSVDVQVTIHEGKNRQIRKMFALFGYKLYSLKRVSVGSLRLGALETGAWRHLSAREVSDLMGTKEKRNFGAPKKQNRPKA